PPEIQNYLVVVNPDFNGKRGIRHKNLITSAVERINDLPGGSHYRQKPGSRQPFSPIVYKQCRARVFPSPVHVPLIALQNAVDSSFKNSGDLSILKRPTHAAQTKPVQDRLMELDEVQILKKSLAVTSILAGHQAIAHIKTGVIEQVSHERGP